MDARKVFKMPVRAYDIASGKTVDATRYFAGEPMAADTWQNQMLKTQKVGSRIAYSNEWSGAQRRYKQAQPDQELKLVDNAAWTGTILDFNDETLKEGVTLNDDGEIVGAKTTLGKKDGIVLPHKSMYVKDITDEGVLKLVSYLHGLDPKKNLPDYAYMSVEPSGIKPVVRGGWDHHGRDYGRVDVDADYGPAYGRFAAWQVDEAHPKNVITPQKYASLEAEVRRAQERLAENIVLVE